MIPWSNKVIQIKGKQVHVINSKQDIRSHTSKTILCLSRSYWSQKSVSDILHTEILYEALSFKAHLKFVFPSIRNSFTWVTTRSIIKTCVSTILLAEIIWCFLHISRDTYIFSMGNMMQLTFLIIHSDNEYGGNWSEGSSLERFIAICCDVVLLFFWFNFLKKTVTFSLCQ